jgi:hypothetical protein
VDESIGAKKRRTQHRRSSLKNPETMSQITVRTHPADGTTAVKVKDYGTGARRGAG